MKRTFKSAIALLLAALLTVTVMAGCGTTKENGDAQGASSVSASVEEKETEVIEEVKEEAAEEIKEEEQADEGNETSESSDWMVPCSDAPDFGGKACLGKIRLDYAEHFDVYYYEDGYKVISIKDDKDYLIVPEDAPVPNTTMVILQQPLDTIYLQATAVMALFRAIDGLSSIKFVGTQASGWYIEEAVEAMDKGEMVFAGKYNEPDYETLINGGSDVAIESTMILHSPKVKEMLETLGIPVFVEYSTYESQALGRTEWVKAYAAMLDKEEEAFAFFKIQDDIVKNIKQYEKTDKTVAFFYVSSEGTVVVHNDNTYVVGMINTAGGNYIYDDLHEISSSSSVSLSMEEFYSKAIDADYLVYNASIDNPIESIDDLLAKDQLFADFKAVKDGNVWCTSKTLFQSTDRLAEMVNDLHKMLTGEDESTMTFLSKVK